MQNVLASINSTYHSPRMDQPVISCSDSLFRKQWQCWNRDLMLEFLMFSNHSNEGMLEGKLEFTSRF